MTPTESECQGHFNDFEHIDLPGSPYHWSEKAGGTNAEGTALLHYVACGVVDGRRITLDGSFHYALDRELWRENMFTPTSDDKAVLRRLALEHAPQDVEVLLAGGDVPWFKPFASGGPEPPPEYVTP